MTWNSIIKKCFYSLSLSFHLAASKANKEHMCTTKNVFLFLSFKFQCKHSHEYSDVLFHVFANCLMPSPRGADLEHRMKEALMLFIKENREKVTTIAAPFLRKKNCHLMSILHLCPSQVIGVMNWHYISLQ